MRTWIPVALLLVAIFVRDASAHEDYDHLRHRESNQNAVKDGRHTRFLQALSNIFERHRYWHSPSSPSLQSTWTDPPNVIKHAFLVPNTAPAPSPSPTFSDASGQSNPTSAPTMFPSGTPSEKLTSSPSINFPTTEACEEVDLESRFLVGLIARPADITLQEIDALERGFIDAYANVECGDRVIDNVTIITDGGGESLSNASRLLQTSTNFRSVTHIFMANGLCRGCKSNKRFFAETQGRFLEESYFVIHHNEGASVDRYLQDEAECPCLPPTENAFLLSYNLTIAELVSNGTLANVVGVNRNFAELEEVNCTSEVTEFEATASLTFAGDADTNIPASDVSFLEVACVDSYNEANALNSETCDELFRVVLEAELTPVEDSTSRHLQSNGNFNYDLRVRGSCRGCGPNTRLFGESQGRKLLTSTGDTFPPYHYDSRYLQISTEDCFCPADDPEMRAATEEEFQLVYSEQIVVLRNEGVLTSVTDVVAVEEEPRSTAAPAVPQPQQGHQQGRPLQWHHLSRNLSPQRAHRKLHLCLLPFNAVTYRQDLIRRVIAMVCSAVLSIKATQEATT